MATSKKISIGQIIRRIRSSEIAPVYALFGGDSFLEDYFISELSENFLKGSNTREYFSLDQDSEEKLFRELSAISMFEEKRIIIVREIKKLRSKQGREELIQYLQFFNPLIVLVIINSEYDLRNSFLKKIVNHSELLDVRSPFKEKMQEWVRYIVNNRNIKITDDAMAHYIRIYGDSTAHVINEIEKTSIMLKGEEINEDNMDKIEGFDRIFQLWHLQDSLGKKELQTSLGICSSLLENNISIPRILVNLFYLFQQILWKKMGHSKPMGFTGINKIITSNMSRYDKGYSHSEVIQILQELRKVDILSKSTSISDDSLMQPLMVKICSQIYA